MPPSLPPQEIIRLKRDGKPLESAQIAAFIDGVTDDSITDAQIAAFAMAVYLNGMTDAEQVALTESMTRSGDVLDWDVETLGGPVADKHSTGGVGDKVSLMLAPLLAACGVFVPMISGRGLGHIGGTLDKLDSIPGYDTLPGIDHFRTVVHDVGCAIIGQTGDLAPADRRIYRVRDVTATVESIPLITGSILSKKMAAGLEALVLDVKFGNGAFMEDRTRAEALARNLIAVANKAGLRTGAILSDMNQVLGRTVGNALEVREAIGFLRSPDKAEPRLKEVTMALCAEILLQTGIEDDEAAARAQCEKALSNGAAAERFQQMIAALGGPADLLEKADDSLARAPVVKDLYPSRSGTLAAMDTRAVGLTLIGLGGARHRAEDDIDPAVGLSDVASIGEPVGPDRPVCRIHARNDADADAAGEAVLAAITISGEPADPGPVIAGRFQSG